MLEKSPGVFIISKSLNFRVDLQPVISSAANNCRTLSKAISCKGVQQYITQLLQLGLRNKNKSWYLLLLLRGEQGSGIQKICTYSSCRGDTVKTFNTI